MSREEGVVDNMSVDTQGLITKDPGLVEKEGPTLRDRLVLAFARMDDLLKNPNLTPDERYAIVAPLVFWIE